MNYNKYLKSPLPPLLKGARIGIDARFYGPVGKGLGRYTQEIVDNITGLDRENDYVIFLRRENFSEFKSSSPRVKKVLADIKWYGSAEQLIFPFYIWRERLSLMHFPHFNVPLLCPVKFVVTIHDLILIKFSTVRATALGPLAYKIKNLAYKLVILAAVKRAKKVFAVSECTKNDIVKQFKINPNKVVVTYEGVAALAPFNKGGKEDLINPPYLLYVGNAYPHKNLEGLIKVFAQIKTPLDKGGKGDLQIQPPLIKGGRGDLSLVLVGKEDYFYNRLKKYAQNFSGIIFPGYVPDADLAELYANALAYVFPSFYEGFGLPPLEAMARGLAVASSNKTCLPEILGDAALYFNPEDEVEMKNKIELVINDENLRASLRSRGYEQIKKYSWRECAEKTLEVYKNILFKKN